MITADFVRPDYYCYSETLFEHSEHPGQHVTRLLGPRYEWRTPVSGSHSCGPVV